MEGSTRRRPGGGGSRSRHRIAAHAARGDSTKGSLAPLWQPLQTKAGTGIPATPPSRRQLPSPMGTLNEGRDRNPGDTRSPSTRSASSASLNEGRDRNPGDTGKRDGGMMERGARSTKAGTRVPATRGNATAAWWNADLAQRRPGRESRRHARRRNGAVAMDESALPRVGVHNRSAPNARVLSVEPLGSNRTLRHAAWTPTRGQVALASGSGFHASRSASMPALSRGCRQARQWKRRGC